MTKTLSTRRNGCVRRGSVRNSLSRRNSSVRRSRHHRKRNPDDNDEDSHLIYRYTRAQAIEDGILVDLTEWASAKTGFRGGFNVPVAVTVSVWEDLNKIPPSRHIEDVRGRAHDLLWIASLAARGAKPNQSEILFEVMMHSGRRMYKTYKLVISGGDHGEPVITIMQPNED